MIEEDFRPKKAIILSELSTREKERYYQLLLLNQVKFSRDSQGKYIANIRLLAPGIRKQDVLAPLIELKKKKEQISNYAIVFQDRLTKLRQNGFISVTVSGIQHYNYDFNYNNYPRFVSLIAFDREVVRPKLRPLSWVMKLIEDIYDSRFAHEKHDVEREEDMSSFDLILLIFPIFVVRRLGTNVGLKSLVDQTCWDLLFSMDYYRNDYLECELFGRFLQEFYDHNDLLFYLYVRSVIAKVLHIHFKNRWTMNKFDGPGRQPQSLWMSYREALHITGIIFGKDNREMIRDFMSMITPQMVGSVNDSTDSRRIDITEYLHLSVVGYHQSQSRNANANNNDGGGIGERYLVPLPGQVAPMEPVPKLPQKSSHHHNYDTEEGAGEEDQINTGELGIRDTNRHPVQVLGAKSQDYSLSAAAEAYDLEEEERGYEAEYKAMQQQQQGREERGGGRGGGGGNTFQEVQNLPLFYDENEPQFSPIRGERGNSFDNIPFDQSQPGGGGGFAAGDDGGNAFEQLQSDREQEFMNQLCYPLAEAPTDVYEYVSATLKERLHETVS